MSRRDGAQAKEVNDHSDPVLSGDDGLRHAEAPLGDGPHIAAHLEEEGPSLLPAVRLQNHLDGEVRGAAPAGGGDHQVAVVAPVRQIGPLLGLGEFVERQVAGVPHEAVAGDREAEVVPIRVVDREGPDGLRNTAQERIRQRDLFEETIRLQHLESVHRRGPEDVGVRLRACLTKVGDGGVGLLGLDDHADARPGRLEGLLVGLEELLREGGDDHQFLGRREGRRRPQERHRTREV